MKPRVRMQDESVESGDRQGIPLRRLVEESGAFPCEEGEGGKELLRLHPLGHPVDLRRSQNMDLKLGKY